MEAEFGYDGLAERLRVALDGLAPTDVAIRKELQKVLAEQKRQKQKQAKAFKGFFEKLDIYDDKDPAKKPKLAEEEGEYVLRVPRA